eukprot:2777532-Rhodomonas_salina.1
MYSTTRKVRFPSRVVPGKVAWYQESVVDFGLRVYSSARLSMTWFGKWRYDPPMSVPDIA